MKSEMSHAQRLYSPGRIGVAGRGQRRRRDTLGWTAAPPHLEEGLVALVTVVHVRAPAIGLSVQFLLHVSVAPSNPFDQPVCMQSSSMRAYALLFSLV